MPSADFWQPIRDSRESLSPDSRTPARSPGVSSPAFGAQPLDLHSEPLMDMGLSVISPLARLGMPPIQFLFVGSRLCSTLLSDTLLRDRCPCASLRLHLHQVGEGTSTPKLMNMPSTPKKSQEKAPGHQKEDTQKRTAHILKHARTGKGYTVVQFGDYVLIRSWRRVTVLANSTDQSQAGPSVTNLGLCAIWGVQ